MKKIFLILFFLSIINFTYWENISLDEFLVIKNEFDTNYIDKLDYDKVEQKIDNKKCYYYEKWDDFIMSPLCFIDKDYPKIEFIDAIDYSLDYIKWFDGIFDIWSEYFSFYGSTPIFYPKINSLEYYIDENDLLLLKYLSLKEYQIIVPKMYIARTELNKYSLYVVDKDLVGRSDCRQHNYLMALQILDKLYLRPWEIFNINSKLVNLKWYCNFWSTKYLFYGWVCWASTQLFRNSLINPFVKINKRYNHVQRYAHFYGDYIYGDDASIYEWDKQFEIENIWSDPIYYRIMERNWIRYLISAIPNKSQYITHVTRRQSRSLSADVWKEVVNKYTFIKRYDQTRISNYMSKNWETD